MSRGNRHRWHNMMDRCYKPANPGYRNYGGRGITVCEAWHDFATYDAAIGVVPPGMTVDRIDNNLGYFPGNVRIATWLTQGNNRRGNRRITWKGDTRTLAEWSRHLDVNRDKIMHRANLGWDAERIFADVLKPPAPSPVSEAVKRGVSYKTAVYRYKVKGITDPDELAKPTNYGRLVTLDGVARPIDEWALIKGVNKSTVRHRLARGWSVEDAFAMASEPIRMLTYQGETMSIAQWAQRVGINQNCIRNRLKRGWTVEDALTTPTAEKPPDITFRGETKSIQEWTDTLGVDYYTLRLRLAKGWTVEDAFTTPYEKPLNRGRPPKMLTLDGVTDTLQHWAKQHGLTCQTVHNRLQRGWTVEDALTTPVIRAGKRS